ncbi:MAG: PhzF family phenazine biosynthesis protein [Pseudomonadota bacterium]
MLRYHVYDVFTDTPFTGNPLAIVEGADDLTTAQMQTIARQFNLSETIFVQTPDDPAHTAKVRIFFPTAEIPFAGHPTIGCAIHLASDTKNVITLEEVAGLVPVTIASNGPVPLAEFVAPKLPVPVGTPPSKSDLAAAVGLAKPDLGPHDTGVFEGGPTFIYAQLSNLDALARAAVQQPAFSDLAKACGVSEALYLYAPTGENSYQARMFDPHAGIPEDPATGSATAILSAQLLANGALREGTTEITLAQGVEMGRPSALRLTTEVANGTLTEIRVAGSAVPIATGEIRVP